MHTCWTNLITTNRTISTNISVSNNRNSFSTDSASFEMEAKWICYAYVVFQMTGISMAGVLECALDTDCVAPDATCANNLCECPLGKVFSSNATLCLDYVTEYGASCEDGNQCAWLLGQSECSGGTCVCRDGWRWYQGRCIEKRGLYEACTEDLQCYNGYSHFAMSCVDGYCACSDGYYLRGGYDCRPVAQSVGDECALDSDCQASNTICSNARCVNSTSATTTTKTAVLDEVEVGIKREFRDLNINCTADADCEDIGNAVCSPLTKKCICKRSYFYDSSLDATSCIGELGVDIGCTADSDCLMKPSTCLEGACHCTTFRYYGASNRKCYKSITQTNINCTSDEWCYTFGPNAYCNSNGSCVCNTGYALNANYVCQISGSTSGCQSDSDCSSSLPNSECIDATCVCRDGYHEEDNSCLPNIGTACSNSGECTFNATCSNNVCSCDDGFVTSDYVSCLIAATGLGDECSEDVQCTEAVANARCHDNACECAENYVEKSGVCHANIVMGSYCTASSQCWSLMNETVSCINSKCQCDVGEEVTDDGVGCRTTSGVDVRVSAAILLYISLLLSNVIS